ncbi:MAG: ACT domain-containing protein [Oscillospiraceae bacterium]
MFNSNDFSDKNNTNDIYLTNMNSEQFSKGENKNINNDSTNENEFYIVNSAVLPEVFSKVIYAKKLLASGKAKNLSQGAEMANISRSALYRYKDNVFIYNRADSSGIISLNIILKDEPGVLSSLLNSFSRFGLNILTINQSIPIDGVASVSISAKTIKQSLNTHEIIVNISKLDGIVKIKQLTGR